jgi:RNA polymerase-binding transcription factor DksA
MYKLFLDVLGNRELVDGYQIEDSIAQKYDLKPGTICPFSGLRVEIISLQQVRAAEKAERQKIIKQQRKALAKEKQKLESHVAQKKENLSAVDSNISGYAADIKATTKSIHPGESHDFARGRARLGRGPVRRNLILEKEETLMAKAAMAKKVKRGDFLSCEVCGLVMVVDEACGCAAAEILCCKKPMAPGKMAATRVKKTFAKKVPAKAIAKAPAKARVKVKVKAKVKVPAKAKVAAKKPVAKKPAKAKK